MMEFSENGNAVATRLRDLSPDRRQLGCWSWVGGCLGKHKRAKRIVPAVRSQDGSAGPSMSWVPNGAVTSATSDQFPGISPSLLAPPSSPASLANSGNPSSVQSPAAFSISLSVASASACSPVGLHLDRTATMFTIGPYAHETALVTPPVFSAFTTPPSTAPFTPPPELAHLTTPSSPDVPYAHFLASSPKDSCSLDQSAAQHAASLLISSGDVTLSEFNQLYPESPITQLVSPNSGASGSDPSSPLPGAVSPNQGNIGQMVAICNQETSFLILKPVDSSHLNLEFSASKFSNQTSRPSSHDNENVQSLPAASDLYFHQDGSELVRLKPEWHSECIRDDQDDYKDKNLCHSIPLANNLNRELENCDCCKLKGTHCFRDVKDPAGRQKVQKKLSGDLFTSYNFDDNVKSARSTLTNSYNQNMLHPSVENNEGSDGILQQFKGHGTGILCGGTGTAVDCNFVSSSAYNESEIFELGSKDLKHTLSNKSMSFLQATEIVYPRNFDAVGEHSSGAFGMTSSEQCLDVPRISFSTPELVLSTATGYTDMNSNEFTTSSARKNVMEPSGHEVLSFSSNVSVVAVEQMETA